MANRNEAVLEILKLGFEFENSVARPEDRSDPSAWFLEHIYVPSLLDEVLLEEIRTDRWDVVFLTGNPGDGKSAFLTRVQEIQATNSGRQVRLKHDATEPTDPTDRAAVAEADLKAFLAPLADGREGLPEEVFVVGINKGMLQRAIFAPGSGFERRLGPCLRGRQGDFRAALIDLNERTFADLPFETNDGLFDRLLKRLTAEELWELRACGDCEDAGWCPFLANAKRLRQRLPGLRLETLWGLQELRGDRHATMRDLLATLSYVVVGHEDMFHAGDDPAGRLLHPCEFVEREKANGEPLGLYRRILYNSSFRDDDIYGEPGLRAATSIEAGVPSSARTYGFAPDPWKNVASNDPSRGLWSEAWEEIERKVITRPERFLERLSRSEFELESVVATRLSDALDARRDELLELEPSEAKYTEALEGYREILFLIVGIAKRLSFFTDEELDLDSLTSYRYLTRFIACIQYLRGHNPDAVDVWDDVSRSTIPVGLIESEGLRAAEGYPTDLHVRWASTSATTSASLALALDPSLSLKEKASPYVEGQPNILVYKPLGEDTDVGIDIHLDEFELLHRLAQGFREGYGHLPRTTHVRNFRERLRAERSQRLALWDRMDPDRRLRIEASERVIFR